MMKHSIIAAIVIAIAGAGSARADKADTWCAAHPGQILVRDTAGVWHRVEGDRPVADDEATLSQAWAGDLDGDGHGDLVLEHTSGCGAHECMFEAFVMCPDGTYASVMAPTYGDSVRVRAAGKRLWKRIELRSVGESRIPRERYLWNRFVFDAGKGYE